MSLLNVESGSLEDLLFETLLVTVTQGKRVPRWPHNNKQFNSPVQKRYVALTLPPPEPEEEGYNLMEFHSVNPPV
jgi:hypothetical protein